MAIRAYYVEDAAVAQLEVALRLYFSGDERDLLSVITLAGAAEELFGQLLAAKGIENSIESIKKAIVAISAILSLDGDPVTLKEAANRANRAKIRLKHWNAQTDNALIELDAAEEARDMLSRAIDNYWLLEQNSRPQWSGFSARCCAAPITSVPGANVRSRPRSGPPGSNAIG